MSTAWKDYTDRLIKAGADCSAIFYIGGESLEAYTSKNQETPSQAEMKFIADALKGNGATSLVFGGTKYIASMRGDFLHGIKAQTQVGEVFAMKSENFVLAAKAPHPAPPQLLDEITRIIDYLKSCKY